jgi:radical SAM protein with 4Fe4S-binding SPASM domain
MGFQIGIEATLRCNFTCSHCMVDAGRARRNEMGTEELQRLIQDLADCGVGSIAWSGGEPLLRSDIDRLTAFGFRRGISFGLATNGFLADKNRLMRLHASGLRVIQISVDGTDPEKAARYRHGPASAFERAIRAIQNSVSIGMQTYICTLFSPETAAEISEMLAFARDLGVTGLRYTMHAPAGRAQMNKYDEHLWDTPQIKKFFEIVDSEKKRKKLQVLLDCPTGPYPGKNNFRCSAGLNSGYITSVGDVYACTALMTPEYRVGNTREIPVHDLLLSSNMQKIQREMTRTLPGGSCRDCRDLATCRGGCPGRTILNYGKLRGGSHDGGAIVCFKRILTPNVQKSERCWGCAPKVAQQ